MQKQDEENNKDKSVTEAEGDFTEQEKKVVDMLLTQFRREEEMKRYVASERQEVAEAIALKLYAIKMPIEHISEIVGYDQKDVERWIERSQRERNTDKRRFSNKENTEKRKREVVDVFDMLYNQEVVTAHYIASERREVAEAIALKLYAIKMPIEHISEIVGYDQRDIKRWIEWSQREREIDER